MSDKRRPLIIDWYLFTARWVLYIAVLVITVVFPSPHSDVLLVYAVLIAGAVLNLLYLPLFVLDQYPSVVAIAAQVVDVIIFFGILFASGQAYSPFFVLAVLPVVGGALRLGLIAGFATTLVVSAGFGLMLIQTFGQEVPQAILLHYFPEVAALVLLAAIPPRARWIGIIGGYLAQESSDSEIQRLREAHERLKTVYRLTSTLSATLSYERVLDALLDTSAVGLEELNGRGSKSARIVLLYSPRGRLQVAASRNLSAEDQRLTLNGQAGLIQQAMKSAEPIIGHSAAKDPELHRFSSLASAKSLLCVPLRAGFKIYGVVLLANSRSNAYSEEHAELINAFCNQAVVAMQNAQLYQNAQEDKQRIIDTQEEIRRQLARELHDGPTQSVSAIAMRLNFTKMLVNHEPERATEEIIKLEELARKTAKEIRTMLFTLRPLALETQGLTVALEQYAEKLTEAEGLTVHIDSNLDDRLDSKTEAVAFSIIEEAVNNAKKHAGASNVYLRLRVQQDLFVAEIEDDGKGFDLSSIDKSYDQRGSLGLVNMRERAALVSGSLTIKTEPGKGTSITLLIPLTDSNLATRFRE